MLAYFRCPMLCDLVPAGIVELACASSAGARDATTARSRSASIPTTRRSTRASQAGRRCCRRSNGAVPAPRPAGRFSSGTRAVDPRARRRGRVPLRLRSDAAISTHTRRCVIVLTPDGRISRYLYGVNFRLLDVRLGMTEAARGDVGGDRRSRAAHLLSLRPERAAVRVLRARRVLRGGASLRASSAWAACWGSSGGAIARDCGAGRPSMNELLRRLLFLPPQASSVAKRDRLPALLRHPHDDGRRHGDHHRRAGAASSATACARRVHGARTPGARPPLWAEVARRRRAAVAVLPVVADRLSPVRERSSVPPEDALAVYVTAKQWMWKFAYPDGRAHHLDALRAGGDGR